MKTHAKKRTSKRDGGEAACLLGHVADWNCRGLGVKRARSLLSLRRGPDAEFYLELLYPEFRERIQGALISYAFGHDIAMRAAQRACQKLPALPPGHAVDYRLHNLFLDLSEIAMDVLSCPVLSTRAMRITSADTLNFVGERVAAGGLESAAKGAWQFLGRAAFRKFLKELGERALIVYDAESKYCRAVLLVQKGGDMQAVACLLHPPMEFHGDRKRKAKRQQTKRLRSDRNALGKLWVSLKENPDRVNSFAAQLFGWPEIAARDAFRWKERGLQILDEDPVWMTLAPKRRCAPRLKKKPALVPA